MERRRLVDHRTQPKKPQQRHLPKNGKREISDLPSRREAVISEATPEIQKESVLGCLFSVRLKSVTHGSLQELRDESIMYPPLRRIGIEEDETFQHSREVKDESKVIYLFMLRA